MKKHEVQSFRQQLMELERNIRGDADALADEAFHTTDGMATGNLSNIPVEDQAERGSDNDCEEATIGLVENADARLREINAAFERIDQGIYGRCEECTQEIPIDRLRAVPFARQCIECARKSQRGEAVSPGNL